MSNLKFVHSGGNSVSLTTPTSNPGSNVTFKLPAADGSSGQVLQTDGNGNLTWVSLPSGGVSMHDNWYVGAGLDPGSGTNVITANWTRDTRTETGSIGSAMTESSGLFTFPSTGIYHLHIEGGFYRNNTSDHKYVGFTIQTTTNNGGGYATANSAYQFLKGLGANTYTQTACEYTFDVTDVSQCKVRFATESDGSGTSAVDVGGRRFTLTFTRLGDT
tara:strand:+ start:687 stop:1337 length:651 start_codon:yes stop_codon:yes gene_type:complete